MNFAMRGDRQIADNPKANTKAALLAAGHGAFEDVEDAGLVFFRDADAVIPNNQLRRGAVTIQRDLDLLARTILDGVRQELIGDLLDGQCIEQPAYLAFDTRF